MLLQSLSGVLGDFPLTSRIKFTIQRNRNTLYRACANSSGVSRPSLYFAVLRLIFTLLRDLELCDFLSVSVTVLHTFYWASAQLLCWSGGSPMKIPLYYYYREICVFGNGFRKSLHFVHGDSPYRINSTADFYMICEQNMIRRYGFRCVGSCFFKPDVV